MSSVPVAPTGKITVPATNALTLYKASTTAVATIKEGTPLTDTELQAISGQSVKDFIEKSAKTMIVDMDLVKEISEIFQFEGFDVKEVYRHLMAIKVKKSITDLDFWTDITTILTIFQIKGNINANNLKSLKPAAQQVVSKLISDYELVLKITGKNKRTAMTIPRIAAAFPFQVSQIANTTPKKYSGPCDSNILPQYMLCSTFPALIPTGTKVTAMLVVAANAYAVDQLLTFEGKQFDTITDQELKLKFDKQAQFTYAAMNSSIFTVDERKKMLDAFKITEKDAWSAVNAVVTKFEKVVGVVPLKYAEWLTDIAAWNP